jgi:uncharacterized protein
VPEVIPMFPLGTVLVPGMAIPLHIFEPRYRQLVQDCLAGTPVFGVALIERGSEVGGGDVRVGAGTLARITEAAMVEDGRWYLVAIGTTRVRVLRWLEDDPYPRAEVEEWADPEDDRDLDAAAVEGLVAVLRRVLALRSELGEAAAPATIDLPSEGVLATWQAAAAAGFGPFDVQRILTTDGARARHDVLLELLIDAEIVLRARLET